MLVKYALDNNKQIISEGIETAEIGKYVKTQHISYGQGYYFAKPMSQDAFFDYIEKHQYRVLLDDISALEDNETLGDIVLDETDNEEESPEEFLARTMREASSSSDEE